MRLRRNGPAATPRIGTIAVAVAVFLPALPSLVSRYGYSDDYWFLGYEKSGSDLIHDLTRDHARPLLGLAYALGRPMVGTIDGLWGARLFGLLGVVALALAVRSAARTSGYSERFALTLAIGVGLLPGVQLYAVWAAGAPHGWVCALSIAASRQIVKSDASISLATRVKVVTFLVISALTYQPAVGFFVVGLALALLSPRPRCEPSGQIKRHIVALAAAMGIVFVWIIAARIVLGTGERTPLARNPRRKVSWFVTEVLNNATNTFDITPSHIVQVVVLVLIAAVIVLVSRRYERRQGSLLALTLCAAPLVIYAPNLIVDETWAAYRTLTALSALVLVFILVAARELVQIVIKAATERAVGRRLDIAVSVGATAWVLTVGIVVASTMYRDLIRPQVDELADFRTALRATYAEQPDTIAIRQLAEPPSPPARYDEFGVPSLAKEWVPIDFARAVYRADGRDPDAQTIIRLAPGEPAAEGLTVIEVEPR